MLSIHPVILNYTWSYYQLNALLIPFSLYMSSTKGIKGNNKDTRTFVEIKKNWGCFSVFLHVIACNNEIVSHANNPYTRIFPSLSLKLFFIISFFPCMDTNLGDLHAYDPLMFFDSLNLKVLNTYKKNEFELHNLEGEIIELSCIVQEICNHAMWRNLKLNIKTNIVANTILVNNSNT